LFLLREKMGIPTAKTKEKDQKGSVSDPAERDSQKRRRIFVDSVARLAEPLCTAEGMELVHVEYQREPGGLTLRVYLDKPGGVTLDDCVDISRQLEDLLDVNMPDGPPYRLEVSSPGLDRPIGKIKDFIRFEGHRARIRLAVAINGRKNFTGVLAGVVDETIQLSLDKETIRLKFSDITRARLINYNGED
jgi:ribosome maturation factor RimP